MLTDRLNVAFRINMLEELGVLTKDDAKRMRALRKLRNTLVHDVRQTRFKLIALVDTEGKRKEFAENYVDAAFAKACDRRCRSS